MASLDLFIVNVALPDIGRDLGVIDLSDLSWVLNGYAILYAALLVPLGRWADRRGRRAGFVWGLALFTAASLGCAVSGSLWILVAFRLLQAVGAAVLTPTSLGLLLTATPADRRARAVRTWSATGALAAAIGPAVGGLLVQASWPWVFLGNLPIGVLALVGAFRLVPESRDRSAVPAPDVLGAALLAVGVGALALALVQGPEWGWTTAGVLTAFPVAVVALASFSARSARHPSPVVDPALLRVRSFRYANLAVLLFSVPFAANLLALVLWVQEVWGYSPVRTGLAVAAGPAIVPVFAVLGQVLAARGWATGRIAALGCALVGAGGLLLSTGLSTTPAYATDVLPGFLVFGAGVGLALPTLLAGGTIDLPPARTATGSAVVNMSRQLGAVLGIALLVVVLGSPRTTSQAVQSFQHAWWLIGAAALLALIASLGTTPRRDPGADTRLRGDVTPAGVPDAADGAGAR